MANPEHLEILKQGVEAWNPWRKQNPETKPDLSAADLVQGDLAFANLRGADLTGANLADADLTGANLVQADLPQADLELANLHEAKLREADLHRAKLYCADLAQADLAQANLRWADLRGAGLTGGNLSGADLTGAELTGANLTGADLAQADLALANLRGADLRGADLRGAVLDETVFGDTNLVDAKALDQCNHLGPSIIDLRTLKRNWPLPLSFLRGCGLPETFIEYLPSLVAGPAIQFYSCFISFSTKDQAFADRLHADLQDKGVRCWYAPEKMKGGEKLYDQIDTAIRVHQKLLLLLSPESMKSEWVKTELRGTLKAEKQTGKRKLFPLRLVSMEEVQNWQCFDADFGKDLAAVVREYFIPDFSNWKNRDAYQASFDRLLRDLKESTVPAQ